MLKFLVRSVGLGLVTAAVVIAAVPSLRSHVIPEKVLNPRISARCRSHSMRLSAVQRLPLSISIVVSIQKAIKPSCRRKGWDLG